MHQSIAPVHLETDAPAWISQFQSCGGGSPNFPFPSAFPLTVGQQSSAGRSKPAASRRRCTKHVCCLDHDHGKTKLALVNLRVQLRGLAPWYRLRQFVRSHRPRLLIPFFAHHAAHVQLGERRVAAQRRELRPAGTRVCVSSSRCDKTQPYLP